MELRPTSAGNGSSLTLAESKFLQNIFEGLGLLLNLKLENPLSKILFISGGNAAVKKGCPPVLGV